MTLVDGRRSIDLAHFAGELGTAPIRLRPGDTAAVRSLGDERCALVVIEGVLVRTVLLGRQPGAELLGEGDLIIPREPSEAGRQTNRLTWDVLLPVSLGRLDDAFFDAAAGRPDVIAEIATRGVRRAQRLAVQIAIGNLRNVAERIVAMFTQLADRWGRVTPQGVLVPLPLSHELIGRLVGAQRPTVTAAVGALARDGRLARRADRTWIVTSQDLK